MRRGERASARVADHVRLYAIGDVHGRLDLLDGLLDRIRADCGEHRDAHHKLVFLGDYVDRGGQSRAVVERLSVGPIDGFETIYLLGNHENSMLRFLDDIQVGPAWLHYGGAATLGSYGISASPQEANPNRLIELQEALRAILPERHLQFLRSLKPYHVEGDYLFVHAGIRPGVSLERQAHEDLIWIRDEFLDSTADHGCIVVHGHSISLEPEVRANRIGIDTGAYMSGVLTCLVLQGSERNLIYT